MGGKANAPKRLAVTVAKLVAVIERVPNFVAAGDS